MSHFSLTHLISSAGETFRRFPLPLLSALAATVSMICVIHDEPTGNDLPLVLRLAMSSYLLMLLTISVTLFTERFGVAAWKKMLIELVSIAVVIVYFFTLPHVFVGAVAVRFLLFVVALHLLVAFAPFVVQSEMNGLWQYNKTLFIRILIGGVYSGVLFAGLALAILAVDKLFEVNIDEKFFAYLWFSIAGIFNTWFFLSGVPKNLSELELATDYPKGLKVFTLYVLLPLIMVYLVILYSYAVKILITADWPVGWVANLVIAFSIFGFLSFLLIYPLRNDESNAWVKFYSRLFYFLLLPLIVLLYVAIFKRIDMYGVTVERYYVVLLAVWLTFIAGYFILTHGKRIRAIPLTLCVIVLLSAFGPWGVFAVSSESQMDELTTLLDQYHVLNDGRVDTTKIHVVKFEDYERIRSIINYIGEMHGHRDLQPLFDHDIESIIANGRRELNAPSDDLAIIEAMRIEQNEAVARRPNFLIYGTKGNVMLNSEGYNFITEIKHPDYSIDRDSPSNFLVEADTIQFTYFSTTLRFELKCRGYEPLFFDLQELLAALPKHGDSEVNPERMTSSAHGEQWKAKLAFSSLEISLYNSKTELVSATGMLMLSFN